MHFQLEMPENGTNNLFRYKQRTNKVRLMFLDVNVFTES